MKKHHVYEHFLQKSFLKKAFDGVPELEKYKSLVIDRSADLTGRLETIQERKDTINALCDLDLSNQPISHNDYTDYCGKDYQTNGCNLDDIHQVGILGIAQEVSDQLDTFIDKKPGKF